MIKKYVVVEMQTYENGSIGNIVSAYDTINEAGNKYHTILASAAVSGLPCHAAVMMDNFGNMLEHYSYWHEETTVPEPNPEQAIVAEPNPENENT